MVREKGNIKHVSPRIPLSFLRKEIMKEQLNQMQIKGQSLPEDLNESVFNILSSYEAQIQSIGTVYDTSQQILEAYQDVLIDTKKEREETNLELREKLARNESLRKKDFDAMMDTILSAQTEREKEVKNLLDLYLKEQKEMARALRENLTGFKKHLKNGEVERVKEFQDMIRRILSNQERRKEEVTSRLKELQNEQKLLAAKLKALLEKGKELRIKDLRKMLNEFKAQQKGRIFHREERREKINQLLEDFKKRRTGIMNIRSDPGTKESFQKSSLAEKHNPFGKTSVGNKSADNEDFQTGIL